MRSAPIPVLMYHSVAVDYEDVPIHWLVYPLDLFERTMADLASAGFHTPTMDELADHLEGRVRLPERSVVLTFDDGYLDNWVFVEPVLRRHGLKGTVWVTKDFVEDSEAVRPTLEDVEGGGLRFDELRVWGYLSRGELRRIHERGTLEIHSHASTHTWWFKGPAIVDYHRPGSPHPWMAWNRRPDRKPFWLTEDQEELVPWGSPVFENARAMVRRWIPQGDLERRLVEHVFANGGRAFFEQPDWRRQLDALALSHRDRHGIEGRHETDEEWAERVRSEVVEIREFLAGEIGVEIAHHCWPGGDYDDATERIALDAGYRTTTIPGEKNIFGKARPQRIERISMPYRSWAGPSRDLNRLYFRAKIDAYREVPHFRALRSTLRAVRPLLGGRRD